MCALLGSAVVALLMVEVVFAVNVVGSHGCNKPDSANKPVGEQAGHRDPGTTSHPPHEPHGDRFSEGMPFPSEEQLRQAGGQEGQAYKDFRERWQCLSPCMQAFCPKLERWCSKHDEACDPGQDSKEYCRETEAESARENHLNSWRDTCRIKNYASAAFLANLSLEQSYFGRGVPCSDDALERLNKMITRYCSCASKCPDGGDSACR